MKFSIINRNGIFCARVGKYRGHFIDHKSAWSYVWAKIREGK